MIADLLKTAKSLAEVLACEAMDQLRQARPAEQIVLHKGTGDWACACDAQIERFLRERLKAFFPTHGFLGEEGGGDASGDWVWVVDPIDGSMNFLRGYPHYSVSIALVHCGEPVVACIADPCRGECFSAALGQGATLDGQPLKVSATTDLTQAVAATVFPKPGAPFMPAYLQRLGLVMNQLAGVRRAGSMALELAYLAAGRIDVFWECGMGVWDAAAGVLLIREAGGEVFTLDGLPWMQSAEIAASAPDVTQAWRELLLSTA